MATDTLALIHQLGYDRVQDLSYVALFAVMFIDGLCVPFTPIELYLILAGYLCAIGILGFSEALAVTVLGALAGNIIAYVFGYKIGHQFFHKYGKYFLVPPARFDKLEATAKRYGSIAPFIFRFTPGIRPFASPLLGTMRSPFVSFSLLTLAALAIWNAAFMGLGFYFGLTFAEHAAWIVPAAIIIVVCGLLASGVFGLIRSREA